jgi:hypothetical protein
MPCVRSRGDVREDRIQVTSANGNEMLHDVQSSASCNINWESNAVHFTCVGLRVRQTLSLDVGVMLYIPLLVLVM